MRGSKNIALWVLLAGATVIGAASAALAGADDGGNKAFWTDAANSTPAPANNSARYRAIYTPETKSQAAPSTPDKDPPSFYHAMGTMGVP